LFSGYISRSSRWFQGVILFDISASFGFLRLSNMILVSLLVFPRILRWLVSLRELNLLGKRANPNPRSKETSGEGKGELFHVLILPVSSPSLNVIGLVPICDTASGSRPSETQTGPAAGVRPGVKRRPHPSGLPSRPPKTTGHVSSMSSAN
jgi:hypothetical protein